MLGEADRATLLRLARDAIAAHVQGRPPPTPDVPDGPLTHRAGAFVTLRRGGELRGCIGHLSATAPLWRTVADVAVKSATQDDRFSPVLADELHDIRLDISVLSPMKPCAPEEVVAGLHGVEIRDGDRRGVLLPQVAVEWKWDREQLLEAVCHKAGLPRDAWRRAPLSIFTAEVFGEG